MVGSIGPGKIMMRKSISPAGELDKVTVGDI
jgi:hypothetical protein